MWWVRNQTPNVNSARIESPEQSPSMPSIRLYALVSRTTTSTVSSAPTAVGTWCSPNRPSRLSIQTPEQSSNAALSNWARNLMR